MSRPQENTIHEVLKNSAAMWADKPAIMAGGRSPMTYRALLNHVDDLRLQFRALGLGPASRIAIVLPNGPEAGVAFLAAAASAVAAPLNPAYRESELQFYLTDLRASAVIVLDGEVSSAAEVARGMNIPVLRVKIDPSTPAGTLQFGATDQRAVAVPDESPQPGDLALLLHTSGTTSKPKLVALTQANLAASAANIQRWLGLLPTDRCLNIMPLFHIHGLIGALLSSLTGGAGVVCSGAFAAPQFLEDLRTFEPTWYSAVPTMHQAILARGEAETSRFASTLRMIRSSSAALPPQVAKALEAFFGVPVVEAYGMTEASHQMCCNPLPPAARKFGSVGLAAGPEVAVMNDAGELLDRNRPGEIVIRGANVSPGYENNPEANRSAFTNGWFRTGDLGTIDDEGYVFLAGRIKEIINRGGEKISPREVDEILLEHPAVAAAVAFAVPDTRLGEEIAAAVVLRAGATVTELELMQFAAGRLADFKVPRLIEFMAKIPQGPTGKIQRVSLAAQLGIKAISSAPEPADGPSNRPLNEDETALAAIWCEVLKLPSVQAGDDFQRLGGDSLRAAQVITRVKARLGRRLRIMAFFRSPTLASVAAAIEPLASKAKATP